jgi:beta-aspartyl-peptidase (threonine type)
MLALLPPIPVATAAESCDASQSYTLLVHGGFVEYAEEVEPRHIELIRRLVGEGRADLAQGNRALDVVVDAIVEMEDSGILDAGKGSIVNTAGVTETDASVMDGQTGESGAVAAMQRLKNPIRAARLVMEKTPHVLFVGTTGEKTVIDLGAEIVEPKTYFKEYVAPPQPTRDASARPRHGTVGAVALDRCGHLAAGTSTGGWPGKLPGRVGDSPIVGASTFANRRFALSATGLGESFIKRGATRDIAARAEYLKLPLQTAADYVIKELIGGEDRAAGAIIAISVDGEIVLSSNGYGILFGHASNLTPVEAGSKLD